nr:DUF3276 family protein [uncultured Porphyromonas sp.]
MEKEWSGSTLLASQKVKAGTRYYYIDAKQDTKGNKYIVLSETKMKESEGKVERHRIFIYEEDFAKVSQALLETIMQVSGGVLQEMPDLGATTRRAPRGIAAPQGEHEGDLRIQSFDLDWKDEDEA